MGFFEAEIPRATSSEIAALLVSADSLAQMLRSKPVAIDTEGFALVEVPRRFTGWLGFTEVKAWPVQGWAMLPVQQMLPRALVLSEDGNIFWGEYSVERALHADPASGMLMLRTPLKKAPKWDLKYYDPPEMRNHLRALARKHGINDLVI